MAKGRGHHVALPSASLLFAVGGGVVVIVALALPGADAAAAVADEGAGGGAVFRAGDFEFTEVDEFVLCLCVWGGRVSRDRVSVEMGRIRQGKASKIHTYARTHTHHGRLDGLGVLLNLPLRHSFPQEVLLLLLSLLGRWARCLAPSGQSRA